MKKKSTKKKTIKKNEDDFKLPKFKADPEIQRAIDMFPKILKMKEKAGRERKRIMKNFLSVKSKIYTF